MKSRKPINRLEFPSITPERARELVDIIAGQFDDEVTSALTELLAGVVDFNNPGRDDGRADAGLNALMQAYTYTTGFHNTFCDYVAGTREGKSL